MTKVHCIDFDFIMILHIWSETDRINWQTSGQMIMINDVPDHAIDKENVSVIPPQYRQHEHIVGILGTSASIIWSSSGTAGRLPSCPVILLSPSDIRNISGVANRAGKEPLRSLKFHNHGDDLYFGLLFSKRALTQKSQ